MVAKSKAETRQIVMRKVEDLVPYARNARTHDEGQVAQIAASIKEFGWTNPVLTDGDNGIVAGHDRVLAARKLGLDEVPTLELAGLSKAQLRAYVLADNKLAENAGWDRELLSLELADLRDEGRRDSANWQLRSSAHDARRCAAFANAPEEVAMAHTGGRPSYKPTDKDRRTVEALAGYGTSHEEIASTLGIDAKTLRKHFRKELDDGVTKANVKVAQSLFMRATNMSGNPAAQTTAAIWWTKARMGWSEKTKTEVSGPDGGAIQIEDARAVLADRLAAIAAKPDGGGEARASRKPS